MECIEDYFYMSELTPESAMRQKYLHNKEKEYNVCKMKYTGCIYITKDGKIYIIDDDGIHDKSHEDHFFCGDNDKNETGEHELKYYFDNIDCDNDEYYHYLYINGRLYSGTLWP